MTTLEDLRAELRQMCRAIGLSGTAASVVPLVVLGVALNVVALSAVGSVRMEHRTNCQRPALRSAAQAEFKVVRTLVTTLKRFWGWTAEVVLCKAATDRPAADEGFNDECRGL